MKQASLAQRIFNRIARPDMKDFETLGVDQLNKLTTTLDSQAENMNDLAIEVGMVVPMIGIMGGGVALATGGPTALGFAFAGGCAAIFTIASAGSHFIARQHKSDRKLVAQRIESMSAAPK